MITQAVAQALLTIAALSFGLVAALADLNRTHARNPLWTGHARFHVVWQTATHITLAAVIVGLVWLPAPPSRDRLLLAAALCAAVLLAFFLALLTMRAYGGQLTDDNGYPPVRLPVAGRTAIIDLNLLLFATASATLIAAVAFILL